MIPREPWEIIAALFVAFMFVRLVVGLLPKSRRKYRAPRQIPSSVTGRAWVIDGDTIIVGGIHVRLKAIDAPEMGEPGGEAAKWHMVKLTKGRTVSCEFTGERSYERLVAWCSTSEGDLGAAMIRAGHAVRMARFDPEGRYAALGASSRGARSPGVVRGPWKPIH